VGPLGLWSKIESRIGVIILDIDNNSERQPDPDSLYRSKTLVEEERAPSDLERQWHEHLASTPPDPIR
jgi:hypothetical protein